MTHFSDGLAISGAGGFPSTGAGPLSNATGPGVPLYANVVLFDAVPQPSNSSALITNTTISGTALLNAGNGVVTSVDGTGTTRFVFDVPRTILLSGVSGTLTAPILIKGVDKYGQAMSETITSPVGTAIATGRKAFQSVISVSSTGTTGGGISVGTSNTFGLNYLALHKNYLFASFGFAATGADDIGTFVPGDQSTPASSFSGDPRGTMTPSGVPDGVQRYTVFGMLLPAQIGGLNNNAVFGTTSG